MTGNILLCKVIIDIISGQSLSRGCEGARASRQCSAPRPLGTCPRPEIKLKFSCFVIMKNIYIRRKIFRVEPTLNQNTHKIPPYLLRGGDVSHDDGIVLVQPGLVQHAAPRGHVDGAVVVRLQHAETPGVQIFSVANQKISEVISYQWK